MQKSGRKIHDITENERTRWIGDTFWRWREPGHAVDNEKFLWREL